MKKSLLLLLALVLLLSLCACSGAAESTVTVSCRDSSGAPVAGVKIQLCTEASCFMSETDDKGNTVFDIAPGSYEIHVYKVPGGYKEPAESVVNTTENDSHIEFVIPGA